MRRLLRVLGVLWKLFGFSLTLAGGFWLGTQVGYGHGARDLARLMLELRQGATETPESWDRGEI